MYIKSNVLTYHIDSPDQAREFAAFLKTAPRSSVLVGPDVLLEFVQVLEQVYEVPRQDIVATDRALNVLQPLSIVGAVLDVHALQKVYEICVPNIILFNIALKI